MKVQMMSFKSEDKQKESRDHGIKNNILNCGSVVGGESSMEG
jgi:hypothetical protein